MAAGWSHLRATVEGFREVGERSPRETSRGEEIMEGLAVMGFVFGMVGVVALVRLEKLTKTLKEKGILEENYKEE